MKEPKVAIITAASRGMGAACARELANRGYKLALMSRSTEAEDLASELGGFGITGSVTEETDIRRLVTVTLEKYGRIDAVVNNTGHPAKGELLDIQDEDWHKGLDLLLLNVVRMSRLVTPVMELQGGGGFVNISSFTMRMPSLPMPVSSVLRAALSSFTKLYADRYARANIRMNCILPGYVENYEISDETRQAIPMNRPAQLQEIARTVAFLLSDEAGYITGQSVTVDGGLTRSY